MAYSKELLDHYENPKNVGSLDKASEDLPGEIWRIQERGACDHRGRPAEENAGICKQVR